jgi:hypothetical protein
MRIPVALALSLSTLGAPVALAQLSQQPAPSMGTASMAVQITQARQRNAALMKTYTWNERADILKNGNSVDLRISLVTYAPDGQLQRNLINDEHAPLPGGFFRKKAAESKMKDMETYLKGLRTLLDQYTLPTAGAVLNFLTTAVTSGPGPEGFLTTSGTNVVQPGDSLTIWTNAATRQTARVSVNTTFQGSPVQLMATFKTLPTGLNYCNYATVDVPAQQLQLNVQNFDYVQN